MPEHSGYAFFSLNDASAGDVLTRRGYCHLPAQAWVVAGDGTDSFDEFSRCWEDLPPDPYMRGTPATRYRRHSVFVYSKTTHELRVLPEEPYWQERDHNPLFGGSYRYFSPIRNAESTWSCIHTFVHECVNLIISLPELVKVNAHLVRVMAFDKVPGDPSPEGLHRDGFRYISIHLIKRKNVVGGKTTICSADRDSTNELTLLQPMDSVVIDDQRLLHQTGPIVAAKTGVVASRDVLLLSYT